MESASPPKIRNPVDISDIPGAQPRRLVPDHAYRSGPNALDIRDIEGAFPHDPYRFRTTRHTNPLNPKYPIPKYEVVLQEETTHFIRDSLDCKDIANAPSLASRRRVGCSMNRNPLDYSDVSGSHPNTNKCRYQRRSSFIRDNLDISDIVKGDHLQSRRCTNPLEPSYDYPLPIEPPPRPIRETKPVRPPPFELFPAEPSDRFYRKDIHQPNLKLFYARSQSQGAARSNTASASSSRPNTADTLISKGETIIVGKTHQILQLEQIEQNGAANHSRPSTGTGNQHSHRSRSGGRPSSQRANETYQDRAKRVEREQEIKEVRALAH